MSLAFAWAFSPMSLELYYNTDAFKFRGSVPAVGLRNSVELHPLKSSEDLTQRVRMSYIKLKFIPGLPVPSNSASIHLYLVAG